MFLEVNSCRMLTSFHQFHIIITSFLRAASHIVQYEFWQMKKNELHSKTLCSWKYKFP